jgi:glycosyltransferase involved in cell wall biosynthesis
MGDPVISVVIPAYNAEPFLATAIESVLEQTYSPVEIVVIDDGSTDKTAEVAKRFLPRIQFISQPNAGHAAARNRALAVAAGSFFSFLDADDYWTNRDKLKMQKAVLDADPALDMVFGYMVQFRETDGRMENPQPAAVSTTLLVRRESFFRVGLFNERIRLGVFLDWYVRAREAGLRERMLADVVVARRIHSDNASVRESSNRVSYARVLKEALDRRRAAACSGRCRHDRRKE